MENKNPRLVISPDSRWANLAAVFPETQTAVLVQAAQGEWELFFSTYLSACWREIVLACRAKNLPLTEVDDLVQELVVRLLRCGTSRQPGMVGQRGNLPERYLQQRRGGQQKAHFRTVLKRVIENLVLEQVRRLRRAPQLRGNDELELNRWLEESVGKIVDQQWVAASLTEAVRQLMMESLAAPTRGQQRLFPILYFALVHRQTAATMAKYFGLDRSNVAGLLTQARQRFIAILQNITGIASAKELKDRLACQAEKLIEVLESFYPEFVDALAR